MGFSEGQPKPTLRWFPPTVRSARWVSFRRHAGCLGARGERGGIRFCPAKGDLNKDPPYPPKGKIKFKERRKRVQIIIISSSSSSSSRMGNIYIYIYKHRWKRIKKGTDIIIMVIIMVILPTTSFHPHLSSSPPERALKWRNTFHDIYLPLANYLNN